VKFTERGEVRMKVRLLESTGARCRLQFAVADTGIGLSREQAARLFQPFTQADMSITRKYGGTGLGLTISRRLVELMGGQIWIESEPGAGSTFAFTVWLGAGDGIGHQIVGAGTHPVATDQADLAGLRVLLVEDNEINQQVAGELLEGAGACVEIAANGRLAVERLLQGPPEAPFDVVLMDLQMPEMDGFQATTTIRSNPRFAALPIVAMTAHATTEERARCVAAGMNDHVSKPIDPSALFRTLERICGTAPSRTVLARPARAAAPGPALPACDGLDVHAGLRHLGDNRTVYVKLLRDFVREQGTVPAQVTAALAAGDWRTAGRLAHTLKGLAGTLGLPRVQIAAADLERSVRAHAPAAPLAAINEALARTLEDLLPRLALALGPAETAIPPRLAGTLDAAAWHSAAASLFALLADSDARAVDWLRTRSDVLRPAFDAEAWTRFARHVDGYAFAEAHAILERVMHGSAG
jgi:CheY-like chemotaxis protein